jgi:hypothetical protein
MRAPLVVAIHRSPQVVTDRETGLTQMCGFGAVPRDIVVTRRNVNHADPSTLVIAHLGWRSCLVVMSRGRYGDGPLPR